MTRTARQPIDAKLLPYCENGKMLAVLIGAAGGFPSSFKVTPPLPRENVSLYELKRRIASGSPTGEGPVPEALRFAFTSSYYAADPRQAVSLDPEELWWMARPFDTVLITSRGDHHYTWIDSIDHDKGQVKFFDLWPESFPLRLTVSKEDFLEATVGLITWDTPDLCRQFFDAFPDRRSDADTYLCFGFALMDAEADLVTNLAAMLFMRAAAYSDGPDERDAALSQAYLAAHCGMAFSSADPRNSGLMAQLRHILGDILRTTPREKLEEMLLPQELCRLANAIIRAGGTAMIEEVLGRALAKDPSFEDAYWLRSELHLRTRNGQAAFEDAEQAVRLNKDTVRKLEAERDVIDKRSVHVIEWRNRLIGGRRHRRLLELDVMRSAATMVGDLASALQAANEMAAMETKEVMSAPEAASLPS